MVWVQEFRASLDSKDDLKEKLILFYRITVPKPG